MSTTSNDHLVDVRNPRTTSRPKLAVVREQLEDREVANFLPLSNTFDISLVTSPASGPYVATGLGLPITTLSRLGGVIRPAFIRRRLRDRFATRLDLDRLRGLDGAVAESDVVCINETHMVSSLQAVEAKRKRPTQFIVNVVYENIAFNYDADPVLRHRRNEVRLGTDLFVAMSPGARSALITEGVSADRIEVIPYGVDPGRFDDHSSRERVRSEVGLDHEKVAYIYTGRLLREKGLVELLTAFADLRSTSAHLLIVGGGPEAARLHAAAASLGIEGRVRFIEWAAPDRVRELLVAADVFVMPSLPTPYWEEQLGFSLVEAMAAGLACVGTDSGSIPFVLGGAGVLAAPYDAGDLTGKLAWLLENEDERKRLGLAARARVEAELSTDVAGARLAEAIQRLVSRVPNH